MRWRAGRTCACTATNRHAISSPRCARRASRSKTARRGTTRSFAAFVARVEPAIAALDRRFVLEDWPAPLAALARRRADDPRVALRFEAYVGGLELANAFGELTKDPVQQRARFADDLRIRGRRGRAQYPVDERLLAALDEGLPPSAGIALGFDRLVMLATGMTDIACVLSFTADER